LGREQKLYYNNLAVKGKKIYYLPQARIKTGNDNSGKVNLDVEKPGFEVRKSGEQHG